LARMQSPDKFNRTHTAYVSTVENEPEKASAPKKKARKSLKAEA
jgi:hypothetical protein